MIDRAGEPYMPSNGTEGIIFTSHFCDTCIHQHPDPDNERQCNDILVESLIGNQPKEWVYDHLGNPTCTAYVNFNWGNQDDGWNEPDPDIDPLVPDDPNQLCFPWDIIEILGTDDLLVTKHAIFEKELVSTSS